MRADHGRKAMLVISSKEGDIVKIGDVQIKILTLYPGESKQRIKIGIEAPRHMRITREKDGASKERILHKH